VAKNARNSGKYFERTVAKEIGKQFGWEYNTDIIRTPNSGGMVYEKADIVVIGKDFPYHIECKYGYDISLANIEKNSKLVAKFYKQAEGGCTFDRTPIVVVSKPYYNRYFFVKKKYVLPDRIVLDFFNSTFCMVTAEYIVFHLDDFKFWHDKGVFTVVGK
jgi:Holliday junction resolvase